MKKSCCGIIWLSVFIAFFIWSVVGPYDYTTWFLEMFPALVAVIILVIIYPRFQFTPLVQWFILLHCLILLIGAHYTYAQVPLFNHLKDVFGWTRNNYDKVGHFFQGFVPALVIREILLRNEIVVKKRWLSVLTVSTALAISAAYELFEWVMAMILGNGADAFLGTQGYQWDTQSDMAFALLGAIVAVAGVVRWHDQQIQRSIGSICSAKRPVEVL